MCYAFWGTSHAVSHILSSQSIIKSCLVIALFFHAALQLTPAYLVTEDTFLPWRFSPRLHTASQHWSQVPACRQFFLSSPYSGSCTSPFNLTTHLFCQRTFIRDLVLWDGLYSGFLWSNEFGKCCTLLNLEDVCVCVSHSVMSDSLWPSGLQLSRLRCPWNSQLRTLEWVAIPFSRGSSQPRNQTRVLSLPHCRQILYHLSYHGRLVQTLQCPVMCIDHIKVVNNCIF